MQTEDIERHTTGRHYLIHTDGACRVNPGPGGWGAVIQLKEGETVLRERELSGGEAPTTTNNRMEMTAALKALDRLVEKDIPVLIRSDSQYLVKGMTEWMVTWKRHGWRTAKGKGGFVENRDLWEQLDALAQLYPLLSWRWVRGHNGDPLNERCDQIANAAIDTALRRKQAA